MRTTHKQVQHLRHIVPRRRINGQRYCRRLASPASAPPATTVLFPLLPVTAKRRPRCACKKRPSGVRRAVAATIPASVLAHRAQARPNHTTDARRQGYPAGTKTTVQPDRERDAFLRTMVKKPDRGAMPRQSRRGQNATTTATYAVDENSTSTQKLLPGCNNWQSLSSVIFLQKD